MESLEIINCFVGLKITINLFFLFPCGIKLNNTRTGSIDFVFSMTALETRPEYVGFGGFLCFSLCGLNVFV